MRSRRFFAVTLNLVSTCVKAVPEKQSGKLLLLFALLPLFTCLGTQAFQNVPVLARDSVLRKIKSPVLRDCWFHHSRSLSPSDLLPNQGHFVGDVVATNLVVMDTNLAVSVQTGGFNGLTVRVCERHIRG